MGHPDVKEKYTGIILIIMIVKLRTLPLEEMKAKSYLFQFGWIIPFSFSFYFILFYFMTHSAFYISVVDSTVISPHHCDLYGKSFR